MPKFFVKEENISEDRVMIVGDDARHIGRSLRMKIGDEITLCCNNTDYSCRIASISDTAVRADILSKNKTQAEPDISLVLFQAVPKSDKLDFIVQKASELGAVKVVPVITRRCVSRPDKKVFEKKQHRLQKIAEEAAKQSGRGIIPEVSGIIDIKEYYDMLKGFDLNLLCYEGGGKRLCDIDLLKSAKSISLFVGSEGGFDENEAEEAFKRGATAVTLGDRILRCETAPLCAISIIMNITGNI